MGRVLSVVVRDQQGLMMDVVGAQFVSTMPIKDLVARLRPEPPGVVRAAVAALRHRDLITVNLVIDRDGVFPDQWIDVLDPAARVARISNFRNFSRAMVPDSGLSGLGMEYFCDAADGLWQMADRELLELARRELVALGLCRAHEVKAGMVFRWRHAYVVPDRCYREAVEVLREWIGRTLPNLWLLERLDEAGDSVGDQADAMASGLEAAAAIAEAGLVPRDGFEPGPGERFDALVGAGLGGYTEPAVPE
jgi:protoporphyrinogen oxidase